MRVLKPQEGPQETFLSTSADIAIYGGAAGGGKTYALLLEAVRHTNNPKFGAVIFRRQSIQITQEGGLWDSSYEVYGGIKGAVPKTSPRYHWKFKTGARVGFAHIDGDRDLGKWQGSQIALIGFDELTHFTKKQFFYMMSRNRSASGIDPYIRATCNPDADSWVADFISWWIDQDTGYPISERSGIIRYMVHMNDIISWFDTEDEGIDFAKQHGLDEYKAKKSVKSVTFIASTLQDNKILMENDPGYLANLLALTEVEKERLLNGNWKIKPSAGSFFKRTQIGDILTSIPNDIVAICRGWDLAATDEDENKEAAYTAGVLIAKRACGRFLILDVVNKQLKAGDVRKLIMTTTKADNVKYRKYCTVRQRLPQDPGQAGKEQAGSYINMLAGYNVVTRPESGSKESRAEPMAAQWQQGFFDVMEGEWNEEYFNQLESFPESKFKDMVDAGSSAFGEITLYMKFNINSLL
ncbi:MAG: phage terminase large subunit [Lachnospiraceae bacterium]|nr:phage terminase large subunit [Lachnospiraceae bacterium]